MCSFRWKLRLDGTALGKADERELSENKRAPSAQRLRFCTSELRSRPSHLRIR